MTLPRLSRLCIFLVGLFCLLFRLALTRSTAQGVLQGHGLNSHVIGDGFQMPGAFQLYEGEIKEKFIHKSIADQPDYIKLADCLSCRPS